MTCLVTVALTTTLLCTAEASPGPEEIRQLAERAVAAIQASQAQWFTKQTCSSCHHTYQPVLAFRVARQHGVRVDEAAARVHAARAFGSGIDFAIQATPLDPAAGGAYRLVAADAAGMRPDMASAVLARHLISLQRLSGEWPGPKQRPPSSHSPFAATALAVRAVQLYRHSADTSATRDAVARAQAWMRTGKAPDTEGRSYQLLGLMWTDAEEPLRRRFARELLATQRPDGGWASIDGRDSEAYSTGEALVALHDAGGVPVNDERWQRGITFLINTQAADGTWHVPSRLHDPGRFSPAYFESGYPYGHDQFISVAGTSWAIMALSLALPTAASKPLAPLESARTETIEPWVEKVLFGSTADLQQLLADGFDPNSATSSGGTTALMMAAPDVEKMRLLIDRGADVNATSRLAGTPLTVAARYGRADAAIHLLIDRGAQVSPAVEDTPRRRSVLGIAAYAGNTRVLDRLRTLGDDANAPVRVDFSSSRAPMTLAIRDGELEVVRALLDFGAHVDRLDGEGWSPLERAVVNNDVAIARLLISRGADVNHVDSVGYSPLLLAASIDFGDTAMIELLVNAGARMNLRNNDGDTALDLARKYGHVRLARRLERVARTN